VNRLSQRLFEDDGLRDTKVSESHRDLGITSAAIELQAARRVHGDRYSRRPGRRLPRAPAGAGYSSCSLHMRSITLTSSWPVAPTTLLE
jgi:hypothetical protein